MLPAAEWRTAALRDVIAATDFRIDDLVGKVVAIEPMAIWCVNCRAQQHEALAALAILSSPDVVYVSLDVDPNERAEDLALYAQEQGFNWRFAVAPTGVSRSLADTFGNQILSPPSTPLVVLSRDGTVVESSFGFRTTDQLVALLGEQLQ